MDDTVFFPTPKRPLDPVLPLRLPDIASSILDNESLGDDINGASTKVSPTPTPAATPTAPTIADQLQETLPQSAATPTPTPPTPTPTPTAPSTLLQPLLVLSTQRSERTNRGVPPSRVADLLLAAMAEPAPDDPKTFKQAMKQPDAAEWTTACESEVATLVENKVFTIVARPTHK